MPKTILFTDQAAGLGGAEHSLLLLLTHLQGIQPHLACAKGALEEQAANFNIAHTQFAFPRLRQSWHMPLDWQREARALARLALQINAQALHANTVRAAVYTSWAARLAKRPFIWHMRDFWLSENRPSRQWVDAVGKKLLVTAATKVIANSQATANHLPLSEKIHVVHNGIDLQQFDATLDKRPFCEQYHIPAEAPVVGMVGRLRPWKGQTTFLHMAAHLKQVQPDCHFVIVGGNTFDVQDDYPQQLKQLTTQLQLNESVTFTGPLIDVQPALAAMDIFIHPGEPEPFGLVNIEAMAMQKPVIAFAHGALPEIVVDGETGFLIPPYDLAAMATQITTLLKDENLKIRLGQNGRKRIETHFTIQQTVAKITKIYEQILNNE